MSICRYFEPDVHHKLFAPISASTYETFSLLLASLAIRQPVVCLNNGYDVKGSEFQSDLPSHVNPSPLYPGRQVHRKLPTVLVHVATELQTPLSVSHSSISKSSQVKMEKYQLK